MLMASGILGGTGVLLGAFGAHALHGRLVETGTLDVWETAVRFQLVHAVVLAALAAWLRAGRQKGSNDLDGGLWAVWAGRLFTSGTLIFSGSLFFLAIGGPHYLGLLTPVGGLLLVGGWIGLIGSAR